MAPKRTNVDAQPQRKIEELEAQIEILRRLATPSAVAHPAADVTFQESDSKMFANLTRSSALKGKRIAYSRTLKTKAMKFCVQEQISQHSLPSPDLLLDFARYLDFYTHDEDLLEVLLTKLVGLILSNATVSNFKPVLTEVRVGGGIMAEWKATWKLYSLSWMEDEAWVFGVSSTKPPVTTDAYIARQARPRIARPWVSKDALVTMAVARMVETRDGAVTPAPVVPLTPAAAVAPTTPAARAHDSDSGYSDYDSDVGSAMSDDKRDTVRVWPWQTTGAQNAIAGGTYAGAGSINPGPTTYTARAAAKPHSRSYASRPQAATELSKPRCTKDQKREVARLLSMSGLKRSHRADGRPA